MGLKIEDIDKNFKVAGGLDGDGIKRLDASKPPFSLHGLFYDNEKGFMRIPKSAVEGLKVDLWHLANDATGGRIKFSTDSDKIEIRAHYKRFFDVPNQQRMGHSGFSLIEETDGVYRHICTFAAPFNAENTFDKWAFDPTADCTINLVSSRQLSGGKMRDYVLFMPSYCGVQDLTLGFDENATVSRGREYKKDKTVLYYGSSITQGACAGRPDTSYQGHISKWTNTDFVNIGLSGNAKGQKQMAEFLASVDCNVFVCDYDFNENSAAELREKHYDFYKAYRSIRPNTPIIFLSKPNLDRDKEVYERIDIIKETVKKAKKSGDKKVYFINGETILGKTVSEREVCSVDGVHPNDLGFYRMAKAIRKMLAKIDRAYK